MATDETILKCLRQVEIAYGEKLAGVTPDRVELFTDILGDLPDDDLIKAARDHIASQIYPPKPAELRQQAIAIRANHGQSSQFEDPENVLDYRRRIFWEAMHDFNSYDSKVMETSKALGWWRRQQHEENNEITL